MGISVVLEANNLVDGDPTWTDYNSDERNSVLHTRRGVGDSPKAVEGWGSKGLKGALIPSTIKSFPMTL